MLKSGRCISKPRLLDKSRALYRRACERDPSFPPLLSAAGKVEVKDAVRVVLPTAAGIAVVRVVPVGGWRFELSTYDGFADAKAAVAQSAATIVDQIKQTDDAVALLDLFIGLERRHLESGRVLAGLQRQLSALEAKYRLPDNNVVPLNNVAAE